MEEVAGALLWLGQTSLIGFIRKFVLFFVVGVVAFSTTNGIGGPSGGQTMARRRYQRGGLRLVDGKWKLEWREDVLQSDGTVVRKRRAETIGTKADLQSERLARRVADSILSQAGINALDYRPGRVATFEELAVLWERDVLSLAKRSTQAADRSRLNRHLLPILGKLKLESIGAQLAQGLVRRWNDEGLSPKSVRNLVVMLQGMMKTAREWGFMAAEISNPVKMPARRIRPRGRRFTIEEARAIIANAPEPWNLFFVLAAMTGLRLGELLGIRWDDVDFDARVIHVTQSVWRGEIQSTKSEESDRAIPIPEALKMSLIAYRSRWTPNPDRLLWANEEGGPLDADNFRNRIVRPTLDRAGVVGRAGLHAFRHLHGTLLVSTGANPKVAQAQLGHAQSSTTMELYVDVVSDDHRKAVEKVASILALDGARAGARIERVQ